LLDDGRQWRGSSVGSERAELPQDEAGHERCRFANRSYSRLRSLVVVTRWT
jgi:hypothetical protein